MSFQTRFMIAFAIGVTCSTSVDSARAQNAVQWTVACSAGLVRQSWGEPRMNLLVDANIVP